MDKLQTAKDLERSRQNCTFPVNQLTEIIYNGKKTNEKRLRMKALVEKEPAFDRKDRYFLSRTQRIEKGLQVSNKLVELYFKHKLDETEYSYMRFYVDEYLPMSLHLVMFIPVIRSQGTPEQAKYWLDLATKYRIIGCYAQTEIGHGSNLGGLETTATFIEETDEFEIHSPTVTSSKWWIGGLGVMATHALVQANLVIKGKSYGAHGFIVPVRSTKDHKPLPGVIVGDIGPKMGFNGVDNGFVRFHRVRIPRANMLMKFSSVSRDGKYTKPPHAKIGYGGMVLIRAALVEEAGLALARGAVIATRFCTMRRQFGQLGNEVQVINYSMVQHRILPTIAQSYAILFAGKYVYQRYFQMEKELAVENVQNLAEVHALTSAMKSYCTGIAVEGLEENRKVIGGHGFSTSAGLPYFILNYVPTNTYEGENYILTQQTAKFLLKQLKTFKAGKKAAITAEAFFRVYNEGAKGLIKSEDDLLSDKVQINAFGHRIGRLLKELSQADRPWDDLNIECYKVSKAFSEFVLVYVFIETLKLLKKGDSEIHKVLTTTKNLYVLYTMEKEMADFLEDSYLDQKQAKYVKLSVRKLYKEILPNAVGLTDAFDYPDFLLNSAIAKSDGNIYQSLFDWALTEPINQPGVLQPAIEKYLRPIIDGKLGNKL